MRQIDSNIQVYTGKEKDKRERDHGKRVVLDLIKCLPGPGYGITTDNFFTSNSLAEALLEKHLTLVDTMRKNKTEIPNTMLPSKSRPEFSSLFLFNKEKTLVSSYVTKKSKAVILLSTEHHDNKTAESSDKFKPNIILHYNQTKGAVDTMDQMVNMLDIAALNAYIIWTKLYPNWQQNNQQDKRYQFLRSLSLEMVQQYVENRALNFRGIPATVQHDMSLIVKIPTQDPISGPGGSSSGSRGRCFLCPPGNKRVSRLGCTKCQKFVCGDHSSTLKICNACKE